MGKPNDILISVEERHASRMLSGEKSVELRRKPLNINAGTRVWVYSKLPRGQVQLLAIVEAVVADTPENVWDKFGTQSAISKREFDTYFANAGTAYAIIFEEVKALAPTLTLWAIRDKISHFHPPQFFKRLSHESPELTFFQTALAAK